jgi:hypothetical protein
VRDDRVRGPGSAAVGGLAKPPTDQRRRVGTVDAYRVAVPEKPGQVVDLAAYRRRAKRAVPERPSPVGPDQHDAEEIVESLLEAMPDVTLIPPPMLREARAFCVGQLANAFPQVHDDHPMLVQLVKEVRAALRRSVPDAFLLQALADAGSVWATPGASHWPVAWLHELAPAAPAYFAPPPPGIAERLAQFLTAQLAASRLPSSGPQAHLSHVLDRIGRCMQMREAANVLGLAPGRDPIVHAYREVAVPLLTGSDHPRYARLDLLIPVRPRNAGHRYDVVIVAGTRGRDDEITTLDYARRRGAIAIRLVSESAAPSLFATDLVVPDRADTPTPRPATRR